MSQITYSQAGDYLLPNIRLSDPPDAEPINKYGRLRQFYLINHNKILYHQLLLQEKLYPHLRDTQRAVEERMETLMAQLEKRDPPPDKASNQMAWVGHMTNLHHTAEEIVYAELIYA